MGTEEYGRPPLIVGVPVTNLKPDAGFVGDVCGGQEAARKAVGVVTNVLKVNVRVEASMDSRVVEVLDALTEVEVDISASTKDWCAVTLSDGREGFIMRNYLAIREE